MRPVLNKVSIYSEDITSKSLASVAGNMIYRSNVVILFDQEVYQSSLLDRKHVS